MLRSEQGEARVQQQLAGGLLPCFLGRPVGHSRSFSLRPTYDNPSDYSRQFSIDPLGSNAQSRYEAVSYIASPTELTRRCFLAGCRGAGAFVQPFARIRAHSRPMLASIPWVIEPENDDMEKVF